MEKLKLYMAPMQGLTEAPFRNLFDRHFGGIDAYYAPFMRWEHGTVRKKDLRELNPQNNTVSGLVPQLIAGTAEEAGCILPYILDMGYKEIDINLGCAFPVLAKKKKGSGILPFPDRLEALLRIVEQYPEVDFSVKMRLGYEDDHEWKALLPLINACRLVRVVMHARIGKQQYKGECNREAFREFLEGCIHPVVYNGDVKTLDDIQTLHQDFPSLQGVMIGRGVLETPWLSSAYRDGVEWTQEKYMTHLRNMHKDLFDHYEQQLEGGEKQLLTKMKAFWEYMLPEADRKLHKKIHKAQKIVDYTHAVYQILHQ